MPLMKKKDGGEGKDSAADVEAAKKMAKEGAEAAKKAAAQGAEAGKQEGKKKMGYLARGIKGKYLEKTGDLALPQEEERRRAEYIQPLLDSLKVAKAHYLAATSAAEAALANAKLAAGASIDFSLAVCDVEFLKLSTSANTLASVQEAQHELAQISKTFIDKVETSVLEVCRTGSKQVDGARRLKEAYYEKRMEYDMALRKLQAACKKRTEESSKGNPEKTQKAEDAVAAGQDAFSAAELAYRQSERKMVNAITEVVVAKSANDIDFLATLVEMQAARAAASQAVLARIQPIFESMELPSLPAESTDVADDRAAAAAPEDVGEAESTDMMAI